MRDNGITSLHVSPQALELHDNKGRLHLSQVNGDVYWTPAGGGERARGSKLSWSSGGAYGLSGGAAELEFLAHGTNFALTRPTKLPVFDGALAIDTLRDGQSRRASNMEVAFKGAVEPISMPLLAKAFGWPEFSGTLAASIPGVTLKDNVLTFQGNVESQVFGGRIVGSNIRLQDPLGRFPAILRRRARARPRSRPAHADLRGGQHHRQARGRRARPRVVRAGRRPHSTRGSPRRKATNRGIASAPRR